MNARQTTRFMERFSVTHLREYLGIIRDTFAGVVDLIVSGAVARGARPAPRE